MVAPAMKDAELVRSCREGRGEAWELLLERHGDYLRRLVSRRGAGDPEAVLQDLWAALLEDSARRLGNWDSSRPLRPYLGAIALNLCRRHRVLKGVPVPDLPSPEPGPLERVLAGEELGRLSPRERLAWVLVEGDGWSYAEAGKLLGIGPGGVGALLSRIRKKLNEG